ncbi:hypothetical protein ACD591_16375 [Rufibacter glacialis]|uniref:Uncharacterized protein n=1 Tax=Rufibacter glacialis TaxID=1259555 RepID=A0A5M8QTF8_9BACT|nr:hypothetical protein [Rufibacter glacialis]KAA6437482.1 hypothetical protein FOE74_02985 [Rufibacter glacialis]GGK58995.1 hypothetical protein GCM10011405_03800 [Rufibacter glacialis]
MKLLYTNLILLLAFFTFSCGIKFPVKTPGDPENAKTFGYHPMDPLPVIIKYAPSPSGPQALPLPQRVLQALPDETMRLAIGEITGEGGVNFGPAKAGYKGKSYVVILDYIKFSTESFGVKLSQEYTAGSSEPTKSSDGKPTLKATLFHVDTTNLVPGQRGNDPDALVPVYLGVGIRLTANIRVNEGEVDLGNLFALGAAASAKQITGTLVVQTLGISGEDISPLIPMPSEINMTTVQNAIMSMATIKSKIYDSNTRITPRVVGVYNTLGGGAETINGFISALLLKHRVFSVP